MFPKFLFFEILHEDSTPPLSPFVRSFLVHFLQELVLQEIHFVAVARIFDGLMIFNVLVIIMGSFNTLCTVSAFGPVSRGRRLNCWIIPFYLVTIYYVGLIRQLLVLKCNSYIDRWMLLHYLYSVLL